GNLRNVTLFPDGKRCATASFDGTARVIDLESGKEISRFTGHTAAVWCVAVSRDGKRAVSSGQDRVVRLWDTATGKELKRFAGRESQSAPSPPDGRRVLSGSSARTAGLGDIESGKLVQRLDGHTVSVLCIAVAPDDRHVVTASADKTLRLWKLRK